MISLLIPVTDIDETISCILDAEGKSTEAEFVLMFDDANIDCLSRISEIPDCNVRIMSCGDIEIYQKVNAMCAAARGNVLMYWQEKNRFLTREWDKKLNIGGIFIGQTATASTFLPRDLYNIMGHYSLHNQVNDYLLSLGQNLGIAHQVDVVNTDNIPADPKFDCEATRVLLGNDIGRIRMALEKTTD